MPKITALFILMLAMSAAGFAQDANARSDQRGNTRLPGNKELVSRARSVHVYSDTDYLKREELESSLLGRQEFIAWDMQITSRPEQADLLIRVHRKVFTNHFIYTVTDRATDTVVMAGKVDSLAGTVYGLIADEIVHKMKVYRGDAQAAQGAKQVSIPPQQNPTPLKHGGTEEAEVGFATLPLFLFPCFLLPGVFQGFGLSPNQTRLPGEIECLRDPAVRPRSPGGRGKKPGLSTGGLISKAA